MKLMLLFQSLLRTELIHHSNDETFFLLRCTILPRSGLVVPQKDTGDTFPLLHVVFQCTHALLAVLQIILGLALLSFKSHFFLPCVE